MSIYNTTVPSPDAVKSEPDPAPAADKPETSAAETTPDAQKADGESAEQTAAKGEPSPEKEPTPGEIARKERNRQRWREMKHERETALARAVAAEAELHRIKNARVDYSSIDDPEEALALRTAQKLRESFAGEHEATAQQARQQAETALFEAWDTIKSDMRERVPDFDSVVTKDTPIHARAAPFIVESDRGGEIAYYLGKNPDVAQSLYRDFDTNPARALIALGRIEAQLSKPEQKAASRAPKPVPTLSGSASPPGFDPGTASVDDIASHLKKAGVIR